MGPKRIARSGSFLGMVLSYDYTDQKGGENVVSELKLSAETLASVELGDDQQDPNDLCAQVISVAILFCFDDLYSFFSEQ